MSDTWNGATREEFVGRVRLFAKKELADMMRAEGKKLPVLPARSTHEELVAACFDALVGKDSGAAARAAGPSSSPAPAAPRYEIRSRAVTTRVRCGHRFTNQPQQFDAAAFTRDELAALKADPYLEVRDLMRRS